MFTQQFAMASIRLSSQVVGLSANVTASKARWLQVGQDENSYKAMGQTVLKLDWVKMHGQRQRLYQLACMT